MISDRNPTIRDVLARVHLQLILFAVLVAASSLTVSGGLVIRNYLHRNLELVARTVAYTVEPAVMFDDRPAIIDGITSVVTGGAVQQVEVLDATGNLLARWKNPRASLPAWLWEGGAQVFWHHPSVAPMGHSGRRIGEVRIFGNPEGVFRFLLAGSIIALSTLAVAVIAARILARQLHLEVIGPLEHIAEVGEAVRVERAFDRRVSPSGVPEIDRFVANFNALLGELQSWHHPPPPDDPGQD